MSGKAQDFAFISSFQKNLPQHHEIRETLVEDEPFLRIGWADTQTPQRNGGETFSLWQGREMLSTTFDYRGPWFNCAQTLEAHTFFQATVGR